MTYNAEVENDYIGPVKRVGNAYVPCAESDPERVGFRSGLSPHVPGEPDFAVLLDKDWKGVLLTPSA